MIRKLLLAATLLAIPATVFGATTTGTVTFSVDRPNELQVTTPTWRVTLERNGRPVTGAGYADAFVASTLTTVATTGTTTTFQGAAATFTASGGDIVFDQVSVYAGTGELLAQARVAATTIADGDSQAITLAFNTSGGAGSGPATVRLTNYGATEGDAGFDNSPALAAAVASGGTVEIPSGTWHFGAADFLSLLNSAPAAIHLRGTGTDADPAVIVIDLPADSHFWLDTPGTVRLENLTVRSTKGSAVRATSTADRAVQIHDCKFETPSGGPWVVDDGEGYGFDRSRERTALRLVGNVRAEIVGCDFRGWWCGVDASGQTLPAFRDNDASGCLRAFVFRDGVGPAGVIEPPFSAGGAGVFSDQHIASVGSDSSGYASTPTSYHAGAAGLTWTIAADSDRLELASLPSGKDARTYLLPYSVVEVVPSQANQPTRRLILGAVDATGADILLAGLDGSGYAKPCNAPVTISGDDADLKRLLGYAAVLAGDSAGLLGGHEPTIAPPVAIAPGADGGPLAVGNAAAEGGAFFDASAVDIIRTTAGGRGWLRGHLANFGATPVSHPAVVDSAFAPAFVEDATELPASTDREAPDGNEYDFLAGPGFGGLDSSVSAELLYRTRDGASVWRLTDLAGEWLPVPLDDYTGGLVVKVRVYAPGSLTNGLRVDDGVGVQSENLAAGWQTLTFTLNSAATQLHISKTDGSSSNGGEVSWVGVSAP